MIRRRPVREETTLTKHRRSFWMGVGSGVLASLMAALAAFGVWGLRRGAQHSQTGNAAVMANLSSIEQVIRERFLFDIDDEKLESGLYHGLLTGLDDPYSVYYDKEEYAQLSEDTSGRYCGIGVMVSQNAKTLQSTVIKVFEGSPGQEAGMQVGDILYQVDGTDVSAMDLDLIVSQHIKGEENTQVQVTVLRGTQQVELTLTRRQIEAPTVEYTLLEDKTGYLVISQFDSVTGDQFKAAMEDLQAQGMQRLVLDLRSNPGGTLDSAVEIAAYLLPEDQLDGLIVSTRDKQGKGERYFCRDGQIQYENDNPKVTDKTYPKPDGHQVDLPMAVLVNENSASASELLTGCLKDYHWATIVGTTTFGKGIVQEIIPFNDGTAIKLTTKRYYTPGGTCVHGQGITPDVEIELPQELKQKSSLSFQEDVQLQKAIEVLK